MFARTARPPDARAAERLDIAELLARADEFRGRFEALQRKLKPARFDWYPYDTFANFAHFDRLLSGDRRRLLALAGGRPVLDLGCADGALAFFLESLGLRVHALDYPASNYNRMQGVQALKEALGSRVEILAADLERELFLPEPLYGLAFLLGTLYHLKNPFHVLESLATRARYLVLSTRIAGCTPGRRTDISGEPVAYLLAPGEANSDWTNFWIFSETGLRRLLDRSGWHVEDYLVAGPGDAAEPAAPGADARVFCLARSRLADLDNNLRLLEGWHELEYGTWRWTAKCFSVAADAPAGAARIEFRFSIPEEIYARLGAMVLGARANGVPLAPQTFAAAGFHCYVAALPAGSSGELRLDFELDKAIEDPAADTRQLGVQVCFAKGEVDDGRLSNSPLALC
jgi:SAM-dependent methyltransferase